MPASLPTSLESLIAEAKTAVETWQDDDEPDKILDGVRDYFVRLSRGEYEEPLYWECAAEDCEAAGDLMGAIAAYRKMAEVGKEEFTSWKAIHAHGAIAGLLSLLGHQRQSLKERQTATKLARDESKIFYRSCLISEAYQYLKLNRLHSAERLIQSALSTYVEDDIDCLNYARLSILQGECCVRRKQVSDAREYLQEAWSYLEHLSASAIESGLDDEGSGVHDAYTAWWRVEAKRRKIAGDCSETEALEHVLARENKGAEGWHRLGWDVAVMQALLALANAYEKNGRLDDAQPLRLEAEEIRLRWHLPELRARQALLTRERNGARRLFGKRY
jgi:tetratricopeptide (TPR) repeat protein